MDTIYFDNAATSFPKAPGVGRAMAELIENGAFNISRGGYERSYELLGQVLDARERLKRLFSAPKDACVCFTGGVTASVNQFLKGLLDPGDHIIVSSVEHNAVMRPLHTLAQAGVEISAAQCSPDGTLEPETVRALFRKNTRAVLCTHASNVCGTVLPTGEIGAMCRERGVWFAVDAAQTAGVLPINMASMCIDFLAFPGHKGLRGPQGVGGFVVLPLLAKAMRPVIEGGTGSRSDSEEQPEFLPDKFESGTLPIPAIIGLRQALLALENGPETVLKKEMALTSQFLEGLSEIPGAKVAGISDPARLSQRLGVISVDFFPADNAAVAYALEQEAGIMTRVGLHCAPRAHQTLGTFPQGTVRFSFSPENTADEVALCLLAIRTILK
ncbi:aminotransferase class V-fold PLP-dependent enzyme [Oscillibacter sp.]|uniref:aminotransferase class V-fold PLP-dependent enzyme n=1 Tax=Oscillibacter sp. TaxID=1945593 RepID=UPI0028969D4E|nr:aminotransferase class V-fold PLP-dependent enzyme [Oscillibacter sp.]